MLRKQRRRKTHVTTRVWTIHDYRLREPDASVAKSPLEVSNGDAMHDEKADPFRDDCIRESPWYAKHSDRLIFPELTNEEDVCHQVGNMTAQLVRSLVDTSHVGMQRRPTRSSRSAKFSYDSRVPMQSTLGSIGSFFPAVQLNMAEQVTRCSWRSRWNGRIARFMLRWISPQWAAIAAIEGICVGFG